MFLSMSPAPSTNSIANFNYAGSAPLSTAASTAGDIATAAVAATDDSNSTGADLSDGAKVYSAQQMIAAVTDAVTTDPVTPGSMVDQMV